MLRQFLKAIFKKCRVTSTSISLLPSINNHQLTVILVLSVLPLYFVQGAGEGERRRHFKGDLGHHTILLQYFVLVLLLSVGCSFSYY